MRVVMAGGGTGGHLFPALAVAEELRRRDEKIEVVFIGSEYGIEAKVIPKEGYPIRFLRVQGIMGKSGLRKAVAAVRMALSLVDSFKMLKALDPGVVIGTGGYVAFSPVLAARCLRIPTLIMEQNLVPGAANRVLSRIADAAAITYHESISSFARTRVYMTGNPVRASILRGKRLDACRIFALDEGRFTVLVFGGSQGARSINNALLSALNSLYDLRDRIQFIHQTGERDYETVRESYRRLGFRAAVVPFVFQMAEAYAVADLVVSRAGATTLAELTALGKPSILIPFPHAAQGHQEMNARKLAEMGASRVLDEQALEGTALADTLRELYGSEDLRAEMRRQGRMMGRPDAAEKVAEIAMSLLRTGLRGRTTTRKG